MLTKKEQIYHAVINLIKQEGVINKLKVSDIAKYADVGKGTVYEYFKSKDEIICETIIYIIDYNSNRILNSLNENLPFEQLLRDHIKIISDITFENSTFHTLIMTESISVLNDQEFKQKLMYKMFEQKAKYHQLIKVILNKGFEEGLFPEVCEHFLIVAISNTIFNGIMYYYHDNVDQIDLDEIIDKTYHLVLKLLK